MFGNAEGGVLSNTMRVESKYNATGKAYTDSMTGKFSNSRMARGIIAEAAGITKKGKAEGYIPNFASELGKSIAREHKAGIPYSQMRIHTDKSGKPIAVTNKKDEPNGLSDVPMNLADGYIPNFAGGGVLGAAAAGFEGAVDGLKRSFEGAEVAAGEAQRADDLLGAELVDLSNETDAANGGINKWSSSITDLDAEMDQIDTDIRKAADKFEHFDRIAKDTTKTTEQRARAERKRDKAQRKAVRLTGQRTAAERKQQAASHKLLRAQNRLAAATSKTADVTARKTATEKAAAAAAGKAKSQQQFKDRAGQAAMAVSMLGPMLANLGGASEQLTETINGAVTGIAMGAMAMSMIPGAAGNLVGGMIMLVSVVNTLGKHMAAAASGAAFFKKASEEGKVWLEKFNASSQAAQTSMANLDTELKKSTPSASKVLEFQRAYAVALGELPAALRRQVLSSANLSDAQEALAKAQMEESTKQKGREAAARLTKGISKQANWRW